MTNENEKLRSSAVPFFLYICNTVQNPQVKSFIKFVFSLNVGSFRNGE